MDDFRKARRRADMSDSDDDEDPFHNKSSGFGFSPNRNKLNMTPTSTIKADSIAGKSRASGAANNKPGPGGKQAGG